MREQADEKLAKSFCHAYNDDFELQLLKGLYSLRG